MAIPHAIRKRDKSETYQLSIPKEVHNCVHSACRICFPLQETLKSEAKKKAHSVQELASLRIAVSHRLLCSSVIDGDWSGAPSRARHVSTTRSPVRSSADPV